MRDSIGLLLPRRRLRVVFGPEFGGGVAGVTHRWWCFHGLASRGRHAPSVPFARAGGDAGRVTFRERDATPGRSSARAAFPRRASSADFHQLCTLVQRRDHPWQLRQEPPDERAPGAISHAQPADRRTLHRDQRTAGEVFILGDDRLPLRQSMMPDRSVLRVPQSRILQMLRFVNGRRQHASQGGRKLRIDQKLHAAALMITWSACSAAKARQARMSSASR